MTKTKITNDDVLIQIIHDNQIKYLESKETVEEITYCQRCFKEELKDDEGYICEKCLIEIEQMEKEIICKTCHKHNCVCDSEYELEKER